MKTNKKVGRIIGVLLLLVFVNGIIIFQVLQGPVLFADNYLVSTAENENNIIVSVLLGMLGAIISITIAAILLPIFKLYSSRLSYLYLAFTIVAFVATVIDNLSVVSLLALSKQYVEIGGSETLTTMGSLLYQKHWWTHYLSLLTSCLPVFVLFYTLFVSKLVPRVFSIIGLIAVVLMFIEISFSIFGKSISMQMMLPMGLAQLALPIWLLVKGLKTQNEAL